MFTGIIEQVGTIVETTPHDNGRVLWIGLADFWDDLKLGESVAVDGVCLTVEAFQQDRFRVMAGKETLDRTTLGAFEQGRLVHIERAMRLSDRLGGHIVQGHVDGVGTVASIDKVGETVVLWLKLPEALTRYCAEKGSLCVNGVSLTLNEIEKDRVRIGLIEHTISVTQLGGLVSGMKVNLEVDVLAKYVEGLLEGRDNRGDGDSRK